ncbi:hypothetical protein P153DRAFT_387159 [Dothidotthia symphoricarpi CBS 119687]|uniref:Uncharacterized protein n=1 Tax=Dothidotthia symphoricarpi CBS 119687 TaxID=1392245 RepID=A0A6A6A8A4_9PLEO|nr:uncharacterized protein P153DRAFT_387159 [Dothidotthia symphoricarpi CBS 119687]KAF2128202.1 hypothetical protein P153DRAFT_387159 [Dothidotthia symphoricarpi CBS 119687]
MSNHGNRNYDDKSPIAQPERCLSYTEDDVAITANGHRVREIIPMACRPWTGQSHFDTSTSKMDNYHDHRNIPNYHDHTWRNRSEQVHDVTEKPVTSPSNEFNSTRDLKHRDDDHSHGSSCQCRGEMDRNDVSDEKFAGGRSVRESLHESLDTCFDGLGEEWRNEKRKNYH